MWENREIFWRKSLEKSLLEQCDDAEEDSGVSEVAAVTSCDVGTTPSDVRSNSKSNDPSQWTRPQSLLLVVLLIDTQNSWLGNFTSNEVSLAWFELTQCLTFLKVDSSITFQFLHLIPSGEES